MERPPGGESARLTGAKFESAEAEREEQAELTRRQWLAGFFWGTVALMTAGLGLPLISYFIGPLVGKGEAAKIKLGKVEDFTVGTPQRVEIKYYRVSGWVTEEARQIAWVVRLPGNTPAFDIFDPHCPHLGCAYRWVAEAKEFQCPCHNGRFNIDGCVTGGPPPRPLDAYSYTIAGGVLYALPTPQRRAGCPPTKA